MLPTGYFTYTQSETCNIYEYEFSNDANFYKYQNLYDENDGYKLIERIDKKTLVVQSIRSSVSEMKRLNIKAECKSFVQNKIVDELGLPYLTSIVPRFDEETLTIEYRGKVKKHIILEAKENNLNVTLYIAIIVTCLIRTLYLLGYKGQNIKEGV